MSKHPFRVAIESGASQAQLEKLFTPDVALKAPMLTQPVSGIAQVMRVISAAAKVAGPVRYTREVRDSTQTILFCPILARSVSGATQVEASVRLAHSVQSRSSYTSIVATPNTVIELFDCDAEGYPMEGLWMQKLNDRGQVYDLTVMLRPYPAVTVLRNRAKELAEQNGLLSIDYWEFPGATSL
jgi:hypothetical protein